MKTIVITVVISAFAFSVNAQQSPLLPEQQPLKKFRILPDSLSGNKFSFKADSLRKQPAVKLDLPTNANIDNMLVARMRGNDNMPVVQTDITGYNMPVVGLQGDSKKQVAQAEGMPYNMPFFGGKPPVFLKFKKYPNDTPPADNTTK
ncbi:hypothetical protein [Mucilaginibacter sp. HD30]